MMCFDSFIIPFVHPAFVFLFPFSVTMLIYCCLLVTEWFFQKGNFALKQIILLKG